MSDLSKLIRFFTLTSVTGVQEVAGIHDLLAEPSPIGDMVIDLNYASATEMVNHMTAYIGTATSVDCAGVVRELIRSCARGECQLSSTRDFSRAVAALAANCLSLSKPEASALANEFVNSVSLTYGVDFLYTVGLGHGEIRRVEEYKVANAPLYIEDQHIVSACIASWRRRASSAITSHAGIGREDLFSILHGLSCFGRGARDLDAINAFQTFCVEVPGGLKHFLEFARPHKEYEPRLFFLYVWDADEMAELVDQSPFAEEFAWYSTRLRTDPEAREFVAGRNAA